MSFDLVWLHDVTEAFLSSISSTPSTPLYLSFITFISLHKIGGQRADLPNLDTLAKHHTGRVTPSGVTSNRIPTAKRNASHVSVNKLF